MKKNLTHVVSSIQYPDLSMSILHLYSVTFTPEFSIHMDSWFWTESVGPVLFSAECLICRHVLTHGLTDELIWGGLSNLRFLQVNKMPLTEEVGWWMADTRDIGPGLKSQPKSADLLRTFFKKPNIWVSILSVFLYISLSVNLRFSEY